MKIVLAWLFLVFAIGNITATSVLRKFIKLVLDPHILSLNKGFETCNIDGNQVCFSNSRIDVTCTFSQVNGIIFEWTVLFSQFKFIILT